MPVVENPDGILLIEIRDIAEAGCVQGRPGELHVPVTVLVADPTYEVPVEEVAWIDLYPKIVLRNGPGVCSGHSQYSWRQLFRLPPPPRPTSSGASGRASRRLPSLNSTRRHLRAWRPLRGHTR
jgi:hypothetical protein